MPSKNASENLASVMPPPYPNEYPKIVVPPPGPKAKEWNARDRAVVSQNLTPDYELVTERASGMVVEDLDGNRFLDFAAGISTVSTGHCHPEVVRVVQQQAERMLHICYTDFHYPAYIELCETLAKLAPMSGDNRVFLSNSGAEAVETAIKLARTRTGRSKVVAFYGAFHGRTLGTLTLTASKPVQRRGFGPLLPDVLHTHYSYCYQCPVNRKPDSCDVQCLDLLTDSMFHHTVPPDEVAAVLVEPIQGEGGFIPPHPEFLRRIQALCREHGILLIADEVQCGMGRTGKLFASEHFDLDPDIVILAKGIASGMPISAVIARDDVMKWNDGSHGSTFGGNPLSCQAALATLRLLQGWADGKRGPCREPAHRKTARFDGQARTARRCARHRSHDRARDRCKPGIARARTQGARAHRARSVREGFAHIAVWEVDDSTLAATDLHGLRRRQGGIDPRRGHC